KHREPTREMLQDLDLLLIDLQDIGARYYTFIWTMYLAMRACERQDIHVVVLDRPNPVNAVTIEGPRLNPDYRSFVGMHSIPVRHGKTIGELATQFRDECFPKCALTILPMKNWERAMWFDQTGLPWVMPSPNMPTFDTGLEVIHCSRRMYANHFQWKQPPYEYEFKRLPIEVLLGGPVSEFFPN